jgi:hypothetical protein
MSRGVGRRCHLTLSATVWKALAAQATEREIPLSSIVDDTLRLALGLQRELSVVVDGAGESLSGQGRRRCRLSIEQALWARLAEEAAGHGVSVPAWIRQRLRMAVLGIDSMSSRVMKREPKAAGGNDPDGHQEHEVVSARATKGLVLCEF